MGQLLSKRGAAGSDISFDDLHVNDSSDARNDPTSRELSAPPAQIDPQTTSLTQICSPTKEEKPKSLIDAVSRIIPTSELCFLHVVPDVPFDLRLADELSANKVIRYARGWWLPEDGEFGKKRTAEDGVQTSRSWERKVDSLEKIINDLFEQKRRKGFRTAWVSPTSCRLYESVARDAAIMAINNCSRLSKQQADENSRMVSVSPQFDLSPSQHKLLKRTDHIDPNEWFRVGSVDSPMSRFPTLHSNLPRELKRTRTTRRRVSETLQRKDVEEFRVTRVRRLSDTTDYYGTFDSDGVGSGNGDDHRHVMMNIGRKKSVTFDNILFSVAQQQQYQRERSTSSSPSSTMDGHGSILKSAKASPKRQNSSLAWERTYSEP